MRADYRWGGSVSPHAATQFLIGGFDLRLCGHKERNALATLPAILAVQGRVPLHPPRGLWAWGCR